MNYLLSYPRSGISWTRYICRAMAGLPAISAHAQDLPDDQFLKTHWMHKPWDMTRNLIVNVRNYKEAIVRHNKPHSGLSEAWLFHDSLGEDPTVLPAVSYIHPLHVYEQWPEDKRYLIYYEDLMRYPMDEIIKLGKFLNLKALPFIRSFNHHERESRRLYKSDSNKCETAGEALHHSEQIPFPMRLEWDATMSFLHPRLYDNYLSRYSELKRTENEVHSS